MRQRKSYITLHMKSSSTGSWGWPLEGSGWEPTKAPWQWEGLYMRKGDRGDPGVRMAKGLFDQRFLVFQLEF